MGPMQNRDVWNNERTREGAYDSHQLRSHAVANRNTSKRNNRLSFNRFSATREYDRK